jgi:hypothetical protein
MYDSRDSENDNNTPTCRFFFSFLKKKTTMGASCGSPWSRFFDFLFLMYEHNCHFHISDKGYNGHFMPCAHFSLDLTRNPNGMGLSERVFMEGNE